jgi:DNA gyrase inhibitor GyrI
MAIEKAWNEIFSVWLPESGYVMDDRLFFERYMGVAGVAAVESKLMPDVCEICIPVKTL